MPDQKVLTADELLAAKPRAPVPIDIPELGGVVHVRGMLGGERDDWETEQHELANDPKARLQNFRDFRARFAVRVLCTVDGGYLFPPKVAPDGRLRWDGSLIDRVSRLPSSVLERVLVTGTPLSGISDSDVKELLGNLRGGPSAASGSGSPSPSAAP